MINAVHVLCPGPVAGGEHVRVLHFSLLDESDILPSQHLDFLTTLLIAFERIEELELPSNAVPSHLSVAALKYAATMRNLLLHMSSTFSPTFLCVSRFSSLTKLSVWTNEGVFSTNPLAAGWTLPLVQELTWKSSGHQGDADILFLSTCRFGRLRTLHLSLATLEEGSAEVMQTFLRMHPHIRYLAAHCWAQWRAHAIFTVAKPVYFKCLNTNPRGDSLRLLPASVRVLILPWDLKSSKPWPLLEAMADPAFTLHIDHIQFETSSTTEPFSWKDGEKSPEHAAFVGRLLVHAAALQARGVHILDDKGMTTDVFSPRSRRT
jgi:hypothetical protein